MKIKVHIELLIKTGAVLIFVGMWGNKGYAQRHEDDYQDMINAELGGEMEVAVPSGYVDILTERYAIEVEFASKWKQAIGQALWYGMQTNHTPGIVLIKQARSDHKYVIQLGSALRYAGLSTQIRVWAWPDDFSPQTRVIRPRPEPTFDDQKHWITRSSGIRHNATCQYFETTNGRYGDADEGVACRKCGG